MNLKFRDLRADEIDVRVSQINEKGCSLLLYKDARCDMNILDETVGAENWQRAHTRDNANCIVSIWDDSKGQWISKEDTGTESKTGRIIPCEVCGTYSLTRPISLRIISIVSTSPFIDTYKNRESAFIPDINFNTFCRILQSFSSRNSNSFLTADACFLIKSFLFNVTPLRASVNHSKYLV